MRVFRKIGFHIAREGKHTIMSNGRVRLTIPRHTTINAFTMGALARDAGLTPQEFKNPL
ncbi:MAG TPA: type II toxin-antitoxin system HicA family toxin [Verrucomicrobiae bacterium]|nr:type II toxin-antitoxin system HicA family toxin [Verrucomicrobiae bacterium]